MNLSPIDLGLLSILFFIVAFLYASVGHGGASGYLAVLALIGTPVLFMKPTALLLNLFVSASSFIFFKKQNYFKWVLFYPFALLAVPMAFIGARISVPTVIYKQILGLCLLFASMRMLGLFGTPKQEQKKINITLALIIGACIGLLSGMLGIGGGIILSPIILLVGWGDIKQVAAVSALFIFINSCAGMLGFLWNPNNTIPYEVFYFVPLTFIGGLFGALYGSKKYSFFILKYILSAVLLLACAKLIFL